MTYQLIHGRSIIVGAYDACPACASIHDVAGYPESKSEPGPTIFVQESKAEGV